MKRHNKGLEELQKSKEEFYEQQVKRKNRLDELRIQIVNARVTEQQTDKAFVLLNNELNKLKREDNLSRNRQSPVISDFYPLPRKCINISLYLQLLLEALSVLVGISFTKLCKE